LKTVVKPKLSFVFNQNISTLWMKDAEDKKVEDESELENITLTGVDVYLIHSPK
jgi:hypothetical protein